MTIFRPLDVVVDLFPFTDAPVRKPRPILVVSSDHFNAAHDQIIGAMITTAQAGAWPSDALIENLRAAGLSHASVIRAKLFTLRRELIATRIGALAETDAKRARALIAGALITPHFD